ncbi:MAG: hypothetical protein ABI690_00180 [Chloroflexota bacterium]
MPVHIQWDNPEKSIIMARYEGRWTWEEFYQAAKDCEALAATVPHQINIIADMVDGFLPQGAPFGHAQKVASHNGPQMGFIVVVSGSRFIQGLMNVSARVVPVWREKYRAANSVEEARRMIEEERRKLAS